MKSPLKGEELSCYLTRSLDAPTQTTKFIMLFMLTACLQVSARCDAQRIRIDARKEALEKILNSIEKETGYTSFAASSVLRHARPVTITLLDVPVEDAIDTIMKIEDLNYEITDSQLFISPGPRQPEGGGQPEKINVRGTIVNEEGTPLEAASISIKDGRGRGMTNNNGMFELKNIPLGTVLIASFTGYYSQEFAAGRESIRLTLTRSDSLLDKAQVISYGTTTERLRTGNIAIVSEEEMEKQPVSNPLLALEGRIPGLDITPANGLPGAGTTVRIQGQNSIANGNDPLILIDGTPFSSQMLPTTISSQLGSSGGPSGATGNPLSFVNPADIESVTVLKDADATAIYGSKGANGVILITTKKGKIGDSKFMLNAQEGSGGMPERLRQMKLRQYLEMRREALANDQILQPASSDYDINGIWDSTRYTNWQKELVGNAACYTNLNAGISGGNATTQFLVSGTYYRQTAVFPGNFADTHASIYFSLNNKSANGRFSMQVMASGLHDNNRLPQIDLTGQAVTLAPDAPSLYQPNGALNWGLLPSGMATWANPLAYLYKTYQEKGENVYGHIDLGYQILTGLDVKLNAGYSGLYTNEFSGNKLESLPPATAAVQGTNGRSAYYTNNSMESWILEPQLNYSHKFFFGRLSVLLGTTAQSQSSNGIVYYAYNFPTDDLLGDMHSAGTLSTSSSVQSIYRYRGTFGRLTYDWQMRYLLNLTVMRDGSSRFGPESRFHDFAAVGAGWVFTTEKGMQDLLPVLSFGKVRVSYGTTGNDQIGDYRYLDLYTTMSVGVPYQQIPALAVTNLPNPNLRWEQTTKMQAGIDLRFMTDRILITANYFRNRSSNQLISQDVPVITGAQVFAENVPATVQNTGLEIDLQTINLETKRFRWSTSFNLTLPKNKLVRYFGVGPLPSDMMIGKPLGISKVFESRGVNPTTGIYQFLDSHGNLTTTPNTATDLLAIENTAFPKVYGGMGNTFRYGRIELSIFLQFVASIADNGAPGQTPGPGYRYTNQPLTVSGRWRKPGDVATVERYSSDLSLIASFLDAQESTASYSSASYVRVKNISLTWQVSSRLLRTLHVKDPKCFAHAQNLLTLTRFRGFDPQTGNNNLPQLRMVTIGVEFGLF